ncbi:MAG: MATE family efflux transporter [Clostridia bacterium]|nr:MATE family efflux transporter [Clostridia bacterium]MBQ6613813.1 MATE family efflux transporter [Clostridia bacterium]
MATETIKTKNTSARDMTVGSPYKNILLFALPVFLSQIFQQLYNTADSFLVGKFLGTNALAAVSSSGNLIFLMISFFEGVSLGAGIVISRYFGAGNGEKVKKAIHTNLALGIVCGLFLTVVGVVFTPTFLRWMNTDPEVLPQSVEYFRYYFFGAIAMVMYNVCRGIMNALGDSRRPLYYLIFSSVLNVLLDTLFLGVFRFGVWSAAIATVISQATSVILCLIRLSKPTFAFRVRLSELGFDKSVLFEIIRYGIPSGVQNSVIGFANVILQSQVNTFGKLAMAAFGTQAKIEGFAFMPIVAFNMAVTTFIGQNLGAKKYDRAKKGARFGILSAMVLAQIVGIINYTFAPTFISLFDKTPGVIELGALHARTLAPFYFLLAFSHAVAAVCRGAGKAFVPMIVMLSIWCGVRLIYVLSVMEFVGEIQYIYWAYPITWTISSVIYFIYYRCSDWVHGFEKQKR